MVCRLSEEFRPFGIGDGMNTMEWRDRKHIKDYHFSLSRLFKFKVQLDRSVVKSFSEVVYGRRVKCTEE